MSIAIDLELNLCFKNEHESIYKYILFKIKFSSEEVKQSVKNYYGLHADAQSAELLESCTTRSPRYYCTVYLLTTSVTSIDYHSVSGNCIRNKVHKQKNKLTSNPNFEFIGKCNYYLNEINSSITIFNGVHKIQGRDTNWPTVYPIFVAIFTKQFTKINVYRTKIVD